MTGRVVERNGYDGVSEQNSISKDMNATHVTARLHL